ncbi:EamA family transporter [Halorussus limi]|uniref:EamA family transporter n=1 Tax=Halorussus limi TaxID=2938695 RepID=A0A8U0HSS2_9EURY|nr:EamA family transporter [Halorussus limi]UPV74162.1 EamA family transporter [Halorussus limi]
MVGSGIWYATVSALLWGGYLFGLKRYFSEFSPAVVIVAANAAGVAWYLPVVLFAPADGPAFGELTLPALALVALVLVASAAAYLALLYALSAGDVSYVAPLGKLVPVFTLPLEVLLVGERLTLPQVVGVGFATLAVYLANYQRTGPLAPIRRAATHRPAQLALGSAALYGGVDVGTRVLLQGVGIRADVWVLVYTGGVGAVLLPVAARRWPDEFAPAVPKFVALGAVVAVATHTMTRAFAVLPASVVSPILNTQAIVAVVLGGLLLGEDRFALRLAAGAVAIVGISLIAFG